MIHPATIIDQALDHLQDGAFEDAEALATRALEQPSWRPDALHVLSLIAHARRIDEKALLLLEEAVRLEPGNVERRLELGGFAFMLQDYQRCVSHLEQLGAAAQAHPEAMGWLGRSHLLLGQAAAAVDALEQAIGNDPTNPLLWRDLAVAYGALGQQEAALLGYQRAVELAPRAAEHHYNLGVALLGMQDIPAAATALEQAVELAPEWPAAMLQLGIVWKRQGRVREALQVQRKAYGCAPSDPEVEFALAQTELLLGDYAHGFAHFEARLRLPGRTLRGVSIWTGEPIVDRELVVLGAPGVAETLQFLRFIEPAARRCRRLTLQCRKDLVPFLRRAYRGPARVVPHGSQERDAVVVPLLSLPHVLGMHHELGMDGPYLFAEATLRASYAQRLPSDQLAVGLAWQGETADDVGREHAIPVYRLRSLGTLKNVQLINLQRGPGEEQRHTPAAPALLDLGQDRDPEAGLWLETAALLAALDLVITSDTAIAHLAGALGLPTWLLVPFVPNFRWGLAGNPWYPSVRLFRQTIAGDWDGVVARVAAELAGYAEQRLPR